MDRDFQQIAWDEATIEDCRQIVRLAVREDLEREHDWTTLALVPPERAGSADLVVREPGVACGLQAAATAIDEMGAELTLDLLVADGQRVGAKEPIGRLTGNVRDLLTCERIILNLVGRMAGIATLASRYVELAAGAKARVYDTRKTTPGWRRLEKYAVRCGGARNHRLGLYDAVLVKDNHLAQFAKSGQMPGEVAAAAVRQVRRFIAETATSDSAALYTLADPIIEIEVDSLEQFKAVLGERPDIALLDNMSLEELRQAVAIRDAMAQEVELEASGGVNLETVRAIAATGVDRISVGGLTHAARSLDVGLDWHVER